jgi:5-methylcytosine-specific restriction endonuclease McrA
MEMRKASRFSSSERAKYRTSLIRKYGSICFYCKTSVDASAHIDHKVPIAKGGKHIITNFVLACMQCNQEKHAKDIDEYREWGRQRNLSVLF